MLVTLLLDQGKNMPRMKSPEEAPPVIPARLMVTCSTLPRCSTTKIMATLNIPMTSDKIFMCVEARSSDTFIGRHFSTKSVYSVPDSVLRPADMVLRVRTRGEAGRH